MIELNEWEMKVQIEGFGIWNKVSGFLVDC